jgi:hypothetical protein
MWSVLFDAAYKTVMRQGALWLVKLVSVNGEEASTAVW